MFANSISDVKIRKENLLHTLLKDRFDDYRCTTTNKAVSIFRRKQKHIAVSKNQTMAICGMYNYDRPSKKVLVSSEIP